ncbi:MAG: hypothetical protein KJ592_03965 [Nanoarchaeota archaeon]|nr:hypothetical protein [Nanoarchaeota archaeon]
MKKIIIWTLIVLTVLALTFVGAVIYEKMTSDDAHWDMQVRKPAVYLYPKSDSYISVKLDVNGRITEDIPPYNDGWNVFATSEGLIENKYDYLFYEASLNKIELPSNGWVVQYNNLEEWFDEYLIRLGLNEKEKTQFKEYWLAELPESNYYEIKLLEDSFLKENMNLIINPEPNTIIRLNFYFRPIQKQIELEEPIIKTQKREGFTIVEWGGILENKNQP